MGLYKRKGSRLWWMSFTYNRKQYRFSTGTSDKKTAEKIYTILKSKIALNQWVPPEERKEEKEVKDFTFHDLVEKYIPYSACRHRSSARRYSIQKLDRVFGSFRLKDITTELLENFQSSLLREGLQAGGVNRQVSLLKAMMTKAYEWGMITEEKLREIRKVKPLKGEKTRLRYLTVEECNRLIAECPEWLKPIVIFALHTGMRRGEILSLKWKDVDMKNGVILIQNTNTKTGLKREIPMNETVRNLLLGMIRPLDGNEYVFKPPVRIREAFEKACKRAGIYDFRFHDLRHTFASHLVMSGVDIQTVSKLLGHTTLTMTMRYAHLSDAHLRSGVKTLDRVFNISQDSGYHIFSTVKREALDRHTKNPLELR